MKKPYYMTTECIGLGIMWVMDSVFLPASLAIKIIAAIVSVYITVRSLSKHKRSDHLHGLLTSEFKAVMFFAVQDLTLVGYHKLPVVNGLVLLTGVVGYYALCRGVLKLLPNTNLVFHR